MLTLANNAIVANSFILANTFLEFFANKFKLPQQADVYLVNAATLESMNIYVRFINLVQKNVFAQSKSRH